MGLLSAAIIAALAASLALLGVPDWLSPGHPYIPRALSYSFFHASWWHLAVNSLAIWGIFKKTKTCKACKELALSLIIAVLVYPLSFRPVIGFSNVLYATLGLRTPPLSSPWWRRTEVAVFFAVTAGMALVPRFSATTHIAAFALGAALAAARRGVKKTIDDARRYM